MKKESAQLVIGKIYIVFTVTHFYTGRLVAQDKDWLGLKTCAWVADTKRLTESIAEGTVNEAEVFPPNDLVRVARGAIVSVAPWKKLITVQQ